MRAAVAVEVVDSLDGATTIHLPDGTVLVADCGEPSQHEAIARRACLAVERKNISVPGAMRKSMDR